MFNQTEKRYGLSSNYLYQCGQFPQTAMHALTDYPFFAPLDGVNTMPTDDNNDDLTNWLGLLKLHRVGVT